MCGDSGYADCGGDGGVGVDGSCTAESGAVWGCGVRDAKDSLEMDYEFPSFLEKVISPEKYFRWLQRKASAHVNRDKKRGNQTANFASYKKAIHSAVKASQGKDHYTGLPLDWSLVSKYDNEESKRRGREYKKELAALPTVDHVDDGLGDPCFVICSWRVNDAKHDLTLDEFLALCESVLLHHKKSTQ